MTNDLDKLYTEKFWVLDDSTSTRCLASSVLERTHFSTLDESFRKIISAESEQDVVAVLSSSERTEYIGKRVLSWMEICSSIL